MSALLWGTCPPAQTRTVNHPEVKGPNPVRPENADKERETYLRDGSCTNIYPHTGVADPDRLVSPDATRSIRYRDHEMFGPRHHYHEELWQYDPYKDVMHVYNTSRHIAPE